MRETEKEMRVKGANISNTSLLSTDRSTEGLCITVVPIKPVPAFTIRPTCCVPLIEPYVKSNGAWRPAPSH